MAGTRRRTGLGIRGKLLLAVLTLLLIPWMGYQYLREMKTFVAAEQQQALLLTARAIATVLHDRPELFYAGDSNIEPAGDGYALYAYPLGGTMTLDGRSDDWDGELHQSRRFLPASAGAVETTDPTNLALDLVMGYRGDYLYGLLRVSDDQIVYRDLQYRRLDNSDQLRMTLEYAGGERRYYIYTAAAAGPMSVYRMDGDWRYAVTGEPVYALGAQWRETDTGYDIELRIPRSWLPPGTGIAFTIADVDDGWRRLTGQTVATADPARPGATSRVILHSPEIAKILKGLDRPAARVLVYDRNFRMRAEAGSLAGTTADTTPISGSGTGGWLTKLLAPLYRFIDGYDSGARDPGDLSAQRETLFTELLERREARSTRARTGNEQAEVLLALYPVWTGNEIAGAVLVEQDSNQSRGAGARLLRNLVNVTLLTFLVVTLALVAYASRLSFRIRRLRNATTAAIGDDGRVRHLHIGTEAGARDELGDLSRSISDMLGRLASHTRYLESMPDTLAHEMNNPLNVVSSSLDNLRQARDDSDKERYLDRARNGIGRLRQILTRLTEAATLEDALQAGRRERIDLAALVAGVVEGYRGAFPSRRFDYHAPARALPMDAVPDALVQMLDKLVDNAMDFGDPDQAIVIRLDDKGKNALLEVANRGASLPAGMHQRIFDPMVSIGKKQASQSRLGLGLYVVRLVAEFHGGEVTALDHPDGNGAVFRITLPLITT